MPCLLEVLTYLVHSPAELMPFSSVHSDVGWLESFTVNDLLHRSATGLFKKMRHSTHALSQLSITSCHPSNLWITFCVTVASITASIN